MLEATIEGIGFWGGGLPDWDSACALLRSGTVPEVAATRPSPQVLAANERRRAPLTVAVALEAAMAACDAADRSPKILSSVFTSTHGEQSITDYMCTTLADDPRAISPTKFHNSVHNAAAGYWTIGTGTHAAATAISAGPHSFAQGLLEAMVQLHAGEDAVLLVAYDGPGSGTLARVAPSEGLLGLAMVLSRTPCIGLPTLQLDVLQEKPDLPADTEDEGVLARRLAGNAMQPALPLLEAIALDREAVWMPAGEQQWLRLGIHHD
ncbi:MAG: beta-ketoacyl synthase chain length factor [Stenotrophomonas sp.]|uniref:beta-ketoacyl synthase chain length factor n=1 Tax=Stenotrophomonas sp. TaxID=69392 RepID=UPI003D6CC917